MNGIDISEHNGIVDFNAVKAAGMDFVILRAGYGKYITQRDKRFELNYAAAKAAGLKVGAYWYSYAATPQEAAEEAAACCKVIQGKQFEFPIYYDIEEAKSMAQATANCVAFCDYLEKHGYFAGVYANASTFNNCIDYKIRSKYTTWLAHWSNAPAFVAPLWQYSATGRTNGCSGDVDQDKANCDLEKIVKGTGLNGWGKPAADKATTPAAKDETTGVANKETNIKIIINGETVFERSL